MKTFIVCLFMMLLASNVNAQNVTIMEHCNDFAGFVSGIMEARQRDVPISNVLDILDQKGLLEDYLDLALTIYQSPFMYSDEHKMRAITETYNEAYISCIRQAT